MWRPKRPALALVVLTLTGCGLISGGAGDDSGLAAPLAAGDFKAATLELQRRAARCESGERGREAVLLWATLELDLRNPHGSPQTAARLAARYLQLLDAEPAGISTAESLYLLALDRGARPVGEPWDFGQVAPRFSECGEAPPGPGFVRSLPEHPGTPSWRQLRWSRAQADSLEAELERIRKLLQQGTGRDLP